MINIVHLWPVAPLILLCFWQVGVVGVPGVKLVADKATCGTSQLNYVRCAFQQPSGQQEVPYISGIRLRWEDGRQHTLCVGSRPRSTAQARRNSSDRDPRNSYKTIAVAAGDAIYGIHVCYDKQPLQHVVGVMLSAASGQYVCGNVWKYPQLCVTSRALVATPLSYIEASCDKGVLSGIDKVCWNRYYTPQEVDYVCPAGQGVQGKSASYCKPCPVNTFNPGGLDACAPCPTGQVTYGTGASSCGCPAGRGYNPITNRCVLCAQGTYSPGGALTPCIRCPYPFMTSPKGAAAIEDCLCQPGYGYSTAVSSCIPCALNFYSDGVRDDKYTSPGVATFQPCLPCPQSTRTLKPQAINADRCK